MHGAPPFSKHWPAPRTPCFRPTLDNDDLGDVEHVSTLCAAEGMESQHMHNRHPPPPARATPCATSTRDVSRPLEARDTRDASDIATEHLDRDAWSASPREAETRTPHVSLQIPPTIKLSGTSAGSLASSSLTAILLSHAALLDQLRPSPPPFAAAHSAAMTQAAPWPGLPATTARGIAGAASNVSGIDGLNPYGGGGHLAGLSPRVPSGGGCLLPAQPMAPQVANPVRFERKRNREKQRRLEVMAVVYLFLRGFTVRNN